MATGNLGGSVNFRRRPKDVPQNPAIFRRDYPMFKSASEVVKFIKENDVKFLDVRFTDLPGVQQHFNLPASMIDEQFFVDGQLFDGSSIRGFASIHESEIHLIPDL